MFKNEEKVNEIHFNTKYVSDDPKALEVITDFKNNSYIIKGSTGIGGTTALLNYTKGHCLIISPNVGMIKSKANGTYKSDKQYFIYSDSQHNWNDVKEYLTISSNVIINCTPDQIIKLRSKDYGLYSLLTNTPIFIDEIHAYTTDTSYRTTLGEFMELVYNEWNANFKLSTATPNYNFIDLPTGTPIDIYRVSRLNESLKSLAISNDLKDAKRFIQDQINKKRLVICFTNNINYHKSFTSYKVANLVGQNLDTKLKPYKRGLKLDDQLYSNDVIFLSSSYYAGFDIDNTCSICLISEQSNEAYKISPNNIAQAYGRCRQNVYDALLVNSISTSGKNCNPIYYPTTLNEVNKLITNSSNDIKYWSDKVENRTFDYEFSLNNEITTANYVNRAYLMTNTLNLISDYQLYNEDVLKTVLESYNFTLTDYITDKNIIIDPPKHSQFKDRILNLLELEPMKLYFSYINIKNNLKYKDNGVFSKKLAFEYLTAYLLIKNDAKQIIKKLENKRVKPNEFYNTMDLYLRSNVDTSYYYEQLKPNQINKLTDYHNCMDSTVIDEIKWLTDDWQFLYAIHKVTTNNFEYQIEREIKLYELFYNVALCEGYNTDKNRIRNTVRAILKQCVNLSITLSSNECIWLKEVVISIYKALDNGDTFTHNNSRKNIKSKMTNALLFLMTNGQITDSKEVKNRVYNPLTQLPSNMRCIIPIKYGAIDLTSANSQIVNSVIDTNIGLEVYSRLMNKRDLTRPQAKKLYNSTLNNHKLTVRKAKSIYLDCGYNNDEALQLAKMTANVEKGSFYELMTANEKILMKNYSDILSIKSYRFHDALIFKLEDVENNHITLPTMVKGYKYHVEKFNDGSAYNGATTDIENNGQMIDNKYYC